MVIYISALLMYLISENITELCFTTAVTTLHLLIIIEPLLSAFRKKKP